VNRGSTAGKRAASYSSPIPSSAPLSPPLQPLATSAHSLTGPLIRSWTQLQKKKNNDDDRGGSDRGEGERKMFVGGLSVDHLFSLLVDHL